MSCLKRAYVALGANLGDAQATLQDAARALARLPQTQLQRHSAIYRTAPIGVSDQQPDYLNSVAELDTGLEPDSLLLALQEIEQAFGRERAYHQAPRTLDLDLLLFGTQVLNTPHLTLPHPRMHQRAFVLVPLAELAPTLEIPGVGPIAPLLAGVADQRIDRLPR